MAQTMHDDLFREIILDHSQRPRHPGALADPTHQGVGDNPLCGDRIELDLVVRDGIIAEVAIRCSGCAISTASASLMAERLEGLGVEEARALFESVHRRLTADGAGPDASLPEALEALSVVRRYPMRVKCATLAWHVLRGCLAGEDAPVTTE